MDNENFEDHDDNYEEEEVDYDFVEDEEYFDVSHFVDAEDDANEGDNSSRMEAASSSRIQEEEIDPEEMEETLKKLEEVFCCLPRVLIKRILSRDDVKGNLEIASQRLQEFQDMEDPKDLFKSPDSSPTRKMQKGGGMNYQASIAGSNTGNYTEDDNCSAVEKVQTVQKVQTEGEAKSFRGKKRNRRRKKNNFRGNETQGGDKENAGWRRNSFDENESQQRDENEHSRRGGCFGGRPMRGPGGYRGGPRGGTRGGCVQGQTEFEGYGDDDFQVRDFGSTGPGFMPQPQRGRGNWCGRGRPPNPKPKPRGGPRGGPREGPRGGFVQGQRVGQEYGDYASHDWGYRGQGYRGRGNNFWKESDYQNQDGNQSQFNRRGRGQPSHGRGRGTEGSRGRREGPVYLSELVQVSETYRSCDDLTDHFGDDEPNERDQRNRGRPGRSNRGRGQRGMRRAQSLSSVEVDQAAEARGNEEESRFEQNKLLVCNLSGSTTDDGVMNFIEAMSGEEVKEVTMLGKGKALVTMTEDLKDFSKIKRKGEQRGLDSAQVSIERVPVCTSILVSGISDDTTNDAIELYFESQRNHGGPVKTVRFKPKSGRAVVVFEDPRDMERVLARQDEKQHVLNKAQLSVKIFHEFLDDDDKDDSGDLGATADEPDKATVSQRPEPKAQQLHMAVDPDVMEYVTTTSLHDQLKMALTAKTSEVNWKPNNKMAVIVYRGEDESDSWQSECIEEVQNYLGKFAKRDVQVNKDFWEAVKVQLSSIRACFGVDPPLVKTIDESFVARIVSLSSDANNFEDKLKAKLEEIYREETRKTYLKKKVPNVAEERLVLLKKIKFVEKLQEKNKELEIKLDTDAEEIYFEGPQPQFIEATMKFHKLMSDMAEKKLSVSDSIMEVLASEQGLKTVKIELEKNKIEAVFVIDSEARIVGTSAAQADKAASIVSKLTLEEKVRVDDKSQYLLKTQEWRQLCEELNDDEAVRVHRNNWSDTYVSGFREDVTEAMKKLTAYLENNCIREERFSCPSKLIRRYLFELRQEDLRSIETQLADFEVKIQKGKGDDDFVISGNKEGLKRVKRKLEDLVGRTESEKFDVRQPGLRKYFASGKGERLVKSVEKDHTCAIHVQRSFGQKRDDVRTRDAEVTVESDVTSGDDDAANEGSEHDSDEDDEEAAVSDADPSAFVTKDGHKISWRPGNIETEQAHILVSSQGACFQAIVNAGGAAMRQGFVNPNTGDITVIPGFSLGCNHVIHTNCSKWNGGTGEAALRSIVQKCLQKSEELGGRSIAFPVIGTGNLNFPPDAASKIMLEEVIGFCQANPASTVKDIRFVVFQQDQALVTSFKQEMAILKSKHKFRTGYTMRSLFKNLRSRFARSNQTPTKKKDGVSIEVLQGNLCHESTDAIVNINSKDMNMESAGALSKAVKQAAGPGVQGECTQLGTQLGGSAVITSGGNLAAPHIIHLIPDSSNKNHLQQCMEKCLQVAEAHGVQSISFPAIGTGAFKMSAADSASLIFQALSNFSASFSIIRKVRIVIFQAQMLQAFQQEQQRHQLFLNRSVAQPRVSMGTGLTTEVINGDLTQETTDAIMNITSTDMNMNNAGELSKAISKAGGPQIQQECTQMGKQTAGTAVMTSGGNLAAPHVIHIVPGSSDKQHLQSCLEAGLRLADTNNLQTISIPSVGTGGYGLAAADSAQVTFQALNAFSGSCKNVRKVRVVVFQSQMMQEFIQAQQGQTVQGVDEQEGDSSSDDGVVRQPRKRGIKISAMNDHSVSIFVTGKDKASVGKAVDALKKGFSDACMTQKVENETVSQLSQKEINTLRRKAKDRDVRLEIEADVDRIVVRGDPAEVTGMVGEIWHEINGRNKKIQEEQQAMLVSKNIEWSYEIRGAQMVFGTKTNAKIEMAYSKEQATVQVSLLSDEFAIDLKAKTGRGRRTGETITLSRKVKGAEEGIPLPGHWAPMPPSEKTVHRVQLAPGSSEYQDVLRKMQATAGALPVQKIERIQNPHLYQSYMVRKQKMDKDYGGNSERQLFHGTDGKNISHINAQGFNRSFCGAHGTAYGRGVYFARDASYSVGYAGRGGGGHFMYLARVLVGKYCVGNSSMIVPPPKDPTRPEILHDSVVNQLGNPGIFVVFFDNQCYPEYLITF